LGAEIDGARIVVDENCKTTIDGVYAVGDCNGGLLQVAKAVADGAKAGTHAIKYLKSLT
jgi:thioredoxin reductase (NADPH)